MNRRKAKEEAARNSNAARRRAAEEKVAEEMSKRKTEMSEEEYKKALEYIQTTKDVEDYIQDSNTKVYSKEELDLRRKLDKELSNSNVAANILHSINPIGTIENAVNAVKWGIDAATHATKKYFVDEEDKERAKFFDQFIPDAFAKAQAKYDPVKPQEVKGGAQQSSALDTLGQFAVEEKDLARLQAENKES